MSVATSTAIAIGTIAATTGASVYGATKQSGAVKDAAKTQAASSDKALEESRRVYDLQRGDLEPYRTIGGNALSLLSQGMGFPVQASAPPSPQSSQPSSGSAGAGTAPIAPTGPQGPAMGRTGYLQALVGGNQAGAPDASPQMVQLRAPNGMVKAVPADQADHFIQLGAQRVA